MSMNDDLNIPKALGGLFTGLKRVEEEIKSGGLTPGRAKLVLLDIGQMLYTLGLTLPDESQPADSTTDIPDGVQLLAQARWDAKQSKDWTKADEIRRELDAAGWIIKDRKDGFDILPK